MVEMKKTISSKNVVPGAGNTLPMGGGINASDYKGVRSNSKPENKVYGFGEVPQNSYGISKTAMGGSRK